MHDRYETQLNALLTSLKDEGRYRKFADLSRCAGDFPYAWMQTPAGRQRVVVWCSNDYLSMGQHPKVLAAMQKTLEEVGAGAGGTRNISGTTHYHVELEKTLCSWYQKPAALVFSSGYVANEACLSTLGRLLNDCVIFSDSANHASMIAGIKASRVPCEIFRHNDLQDLESKLRKYPRSQMKIIAFESVYSMDGDIAPIADICSLARQYHALTYLDEVHGVGLYGDRGCGVAERDGVLDQVDIVQGTFGKAIGVMGGYVVGQKNLIDVVRSYAGSFIFTTALPPVLAAGAQASIEVIAAQPQMRVAHQQRARTLKKMLRKAQLPILDSASHIVPLMIRHAPCCRRAADMLCQQFGLYLQPINYPTVPRGQERFRLTPGLHHTDEMMQQLVTALREVWQTHAIEFAVAS